MKVKFRNGYTARIWIAIMRYAPGACGADGDWATEGWWAPYPGEEVYAFQTNNRYAAYYAESADGLVWKGDIGPVYVYQEAFRSCIGVGSTAARAVGMRRIDLGSSDLVVRLVG